MAGGRPTKFTQELADKICETIATTTKGLREICAENQISTFTLLKWLNQNAEFSTQYAISKQMQSDLLIDEILEICDHTSEDHTPFTGSNVVNRDRLRVDTRKWLASKLYPKKYGDKVDLTTAGEKINGVKEIIIERASANKD